MKIKIKQLVESKTALETLIKCPLPLATAWEISKFVKKVDPELSAFFSVRNSAIVKYGEELIIDGKSTGQYQVKNENMAEYARELNELLEKEIDVDLPNVDMEKLLEHAAKVDVNITVSDLMAIEWIFIGIPKP
jgi:hypothetical protein